MRKGLRKYWFPLTIILVGALQSFATEAFRGTINLLSFDAPRPDTVIYDNSEIYTKFRAERKAEEAEGEYLLGEEDSVLTARDTIKVPDSLKTIDPFRYKYYVALIDSLTHVIVRDSLKATGDTLIWPKIDSIYYADSAIVAKKKFDEWYASLDKQKKKKYDFEQKMKLKMKIIDSTLAAKDSLKFIRDSIAEAKPRVLDTYAVPDSMHHKRIITWNVDKYFNDVRLNKFDTSYNYHFNDYKFFREDVNASYLGVIGSPTQLYDYSKRKSREGVSFYAPYEVYSFSPDNVPMYNTKTPYTELAYWGTLFAKVEREEQNIHILTTQNIYPSLNMTFNYDRTGGNGLLQGEDVNNRTLFTGLNYLGKKYSAHIGYIFNSVRKSENGGIVENRWIRDTLIESREIAVSLNEAGNVLKKNTVYLNQEYRIPFNFLKKLSKKYSTQTLTGDSHSDVTTAFIGHNSEYSVYTKSYTDRIGLEDMVGRDFYDNQFYINPTNSYDSLRVMKLENKVFLKLQPWSEDAVVSTINAGVGNRVLSYYKFEPLGYINKPQNVLWNSLYMYGGAGGQIKKYVNWGARGYYTFAGDEINDFGINANATFNIYPFRRHKNSPITFDVHFETELEEPEYYQQHYYSNHLKWDNDFSKISTTKFEGGIDIPHWELKVSAAYTQMFNNVYYDTLAVAKQNEKPMSIAKIGVMKNFTLWKFHLDNQLLFQMSSNKEVVPLPAAALNLRWYFQFDVVKDVMQMQIGANTLYTSKWYAPSYSPQSGMFHNQNKEEYGNCPYIDAFVNIQWKRACIFVKMVNANMGWPMNSSDYFSADGYIQPQRAVKFGIWWPFYLQTRKQTSSNSGGGGGSRGGMGGGLGGMLGGMGGRNGR